MKIQGILFVVREGDTVIGLMESYPDRHNFRMVHGFARQGARPDGTVEILRAPQPSYERLSR